MDDTVRHPIQSSHHSFDEPTMNQSTSNNRPARIAVLPGDGIGREVMPEGMRVVEAAAKKFGLALEFEYFD